MARDAGGLIELLPSAMSAALDSSAVATCGLVTTPPRGGRRARAGQQEDCAALRDGEVYDGTWLCAADDADPASVAGVAAPTPAAPKSTSSLSGRSRVEMNSSVTLLNGRTVFSVSGSS